MTAAQNPADLPGVAGPAVAPAPGHRAHHHLWTLFDGTAAHAPPGRLAYDAQGRVACHLCGNLFEHLGSHLRAHGWTAERYRDAVGLQRHDPLCSPGLSVRISRRQRVSYERDARVRARLEPGRRMAENGELARASVQAGQERQGRGSEREPVRTARAERLHRGRESQRRARAERLDAVVRQHGAHDLHGLLRMAYRDGGTLDSLRALTGLGRAQLRGELTAAGIAVRAHGHNLAASKQRRSTTNDEAAGRRVGATDIRAWLRQERAKGRSLQELATAVGRSEPWIRARLHEPTCSSLPLTSGQVGQLPCAARQIHDRPPDSTTDEDHARLSGRGAVRTSGAG